MTAEPAERANRFLLRREHVRTSDARVTAAVA